MIMPSDDMLLSVRCVALTAVQALLSSAVPWRQVRPTRLTSTSSMRRPSQRDALTALEPRSSKDERRTSTALHWYRTRPCAPAWARTTPSTSTSLALAIDTAAVATGNGPDPRRAAPPSAGPAASTGQLCTCASPGRRQAVCARVMLASTMLASLPVALAQMRVSMTGRTACCGGPLDDATCRGVGDVVEGKRERES